MSKVAPNCCQLMLDDATIRKCIAQKLGFMAETEEVNNALSQTCSKHLYFLNTFECGTCNDGQIICGLCFTDNHMGHIFLFKQQVEAADMKKKEVTFSVNLVQHTDAVVTTEITEASDNKGESVH